MAVGVGKIEGPTATSPQFFVKNSMNFQIGSNTDQQIGVSLKSVSAPDLGTGVLNESGFKNLEESSPVILGLILSLYLHPYHFILFI